MPLELSTKIVLNKESIEAPNLCDKFSKEDLDKIGAAVSEGYERDKRSRYRWEKRMQAAMDLAMQVQKDKSFPWPNCSNIAFPLVTIGALSFHSRAYPALISGRDVVGCKVNGEDPTGEKTKRAARISMHMSWQCLEEDKAWEEQKDRLLINLPIVGCAFSKSYYAAGKGHNVSETVLAQDLVIDYYAKNVESCPRKTHVIPYFRNELHTAMKRGIFRDVSGEAWYGQPPGQQDAGPSQAKVDNRQGLTPPEGDDTTPYVLLEQHVDMDLDQDGYAEPYIITIEETSKSTLRIVTGFEQEADIERTRDKEIISIRRMEYFTKYSFIPSPDGGIYDIGFGVLLGPLNESVNTAVNQLTDAGTMQTTKGGFLGKGAKVRGGVYTMSPFSWHRVDSAGDDLRKNIVPHEVGEPSAVLFNLLSLLINYVERITGTTDPQVGENPGQNTPAETMRTMVVEGQRVYSAIYKRIWRCMKEEFKKRYILNGMMMPRRKSFGANVFALKEDYLGNPDEVSPSADPNITSDMMQVQQVIMLKEAAASTPGYDPEAVERRFLKVIKVDNVDEIFPGTAKTGVPKDIKIQIQELKNQAQSEALVQEMQQFVIQMQEEIRLNDAQIMKWSGELAALQESVQGDAADRQVAVLNAMVGMMKNRSDALTKRLDVVTKMMDVKIKELEVQRAQAEAAADARDIRGLDKPSGDRSSSSGRSKQAA